MIAIDTRPVFLVGRSHAGGPSFPTLLRTVAIEIGAAVQLGAIVNLPRHGVAVARQILDSVPDAAIRLADPELHLHPDHGPITQRRRLNAPYFGTPIPTRPDRAFMDAVLTAQRQAGANLLLSPTGAIDEANGEIGLDSAMRWVRAARAELGDEPMAVNLTVSRTWLTSPRLREALLNELVDSNERLWYLRVRWEALKPRHSQLSDIGLLRGYALLAKTAETEGKVLILTQTGLTGWLMTGLGAGGYSTGIGGPEQAYADTVEIRIKGTRRPPIPRYFDRAVLHTVGLPAQERLARVSAYNACPCVYCQRLRGPGGAFDAGRWDRDLAADHQVVALAALTAQIAAHRRAGTQGLVTNADQLGDDARAALAGEDRPRHLRVWEQLLA